MPSTKDKILQTALEIFNDEGFEATSARQVARAVGISQGNLRYHFATREDIARELFLRYYIRYQAILQSMAGDELEIKTLFASYQRLYKLSYHYRFISKNLVDIAGRIPEVKRTLKEGFNERRQQILDAFEKLTQAGYLEPNIPAYLYRRIIYVQIFIGDLWVAHSQIYFEEALQSEIRYYNEQWMILLLPYLTGRGLAELLEYLNEHPELSFPEFRELVKARSKKI